MDIFTSYATRPRLLVVDDEVGPRESLKAVFNDRYDVAIATCGQEGIQYARQNPVDLAILDIRMPDISGVDVLQQLKQIDPDIEVVLLTAYETLETTRAAIRFGATDYLTKPFDVPAIRDLLARCCNRRGAKLDVRRKLASVRALAEELRQKLSDDTAYVDNRVVEPPQQAPSQPAPQEYQRKGGWESFRCYCGNKVEIGPAFRAPQISCRSCGSVISLTTPAQY